MLERGQVAPSFDLADQHGRMVSLSDLEGSWVLLWWFPKASTPG